MAGLMKLAVLAFILAALAVIALASCKPEPRLLIEATPAQYRPCPLPNPCDRVDCSKPAPKPERIA